jgi:hypothetical protein
MVTAILKIWIWLPSNILSKYEDRVQEENINLADLADLVRLDYNKSFIWKFGFPCQVVIQFMK